MAEIDDTIIGHIICSHAAVQLEDKSIPVLNFGPLSVLPQYQRKAVGAKLLKTMIAKAKTMGFGAILFFGRPEYYPQFGFVEAAKFIIEKDKASIGLLQRMFRIGFNRAARIMDQLSDAGVVGPEEGTKPRQILMSIEQFENYLEENG